jgi:hypothetical protein
VSASSFQGIITMPIPAVMYAPVRNVMRCGRDVDQRVRGRDHVGRDVRRERGDREREQAEITDREAAAHPAEQHRGSQIGSPKITVVALVTATPMNAKSVIVVGRPSAWPSTWSRWTSRSA